MDRIEFPLKQRMKNRKVPVLQDGLELLLRQGALLAGDKRAREVQIAGLQRDHAAGSYGSATRNAVAAFQKRAGLEPTGAVDEATANALNERLRELGASSKREMETMSAFVPQIAFDEVSHDVTLIHKVLEVLGFPVSALEVRSRVAGGDTCVKIRALQAKLGVWSDGKTLMDDATVAAIEKALAEKGFTADTSTFTVRGTVRGPEGKVVSGQRLAACDMDLRGAAVWQTAETIGAIEQTGGSELLGGACSDKRGRYEFTFYEYQYIRAERGKADVVVFAVDTIGDEERIVGCSRMVRPDDYSDVGTVQGLDITVARPSEGTEYSRLMDALTPFLRESETDLLTIASSSEQLDFAARELEVNRSHLGIAAAAESLKQPDPDTLSHELLYGLGRQGYTLSWTWLYGKRDAQLRAAIAVSVEAKIIHPFAEQLITVFLDALRARALANVLEKPEDNPSVLTTLLTTTLAGDAQRQAFSQAVATFEGTDPSDFWNSHLPAQPEFRDKPELVASLLWTQQLAVATGNHPALVSELRASGKAATVDDLLRLEEGDWTQLVEKSGVPSFIQGASREEKRRNYIEVVTSLLNAAFPTKRIAVMIEKNEVPTEKPEAAQLVGAFLRDNTDFDFASSLIYNFEKEIELVAKENAAEVKNELLELQRVYQVSTGPAVLRTLLDHGLTSAYSIASQPQKSFVSSFSEVLGGEAVARTVYQRAEFVAARTEFATLRLKEYSHGHAWTPAAIMDASDYDSVLGVLQDRLPNYSELFGSPDLCECEHCRSVYSPAAYFVDLLRFLAKAPRDGQQSPKTVLDKLAERRPDLVHLPLTCENTNTIIPYIDLANEVMEFYVANGTLGSFTGHDTGAATAEELRANPQNVDSDAYKKKLASAKYPFTLPYHRPLDVIRTYSDFLRVSRYEAMLAMNPPRLEMAPPKPDKPTAAAIAAEALRLSQEEYEVLTGEDFAGDADGTALHDFYGCTVAEMATLGKVPQFLNRTGVSYVELTELLRTRFLNPYQDRLSFLERVLSCGSLEAADFYGRLCKIEAGEPVDGDIQAALQAHDLKMTPERFAAWVVTHLRECRQVMTLFEPDSKCALATTRLRTIESIYETPGDPSTGMSDHWPRIHPFIRLWRKLGWTIHETDVMLTALGEDEVTDSTISKLESVLSLRTATNLAPDQLATLWGAIDTYGEKPLYRKLFLNRAVQADAGVFRADAWGEYLQDDDVHLADHIPEVLAAFRIREDDLAAILRVATVLDNGSPRPIRPADDSLDLGILSTIYRHAVLARALKLKVTELCSLIELFGISPFSDWDLQAQAFTGAAPERTTQFCRLAELVKKTGFKVETLAYILEGDVPASSKLGLDRSKVLRTAKAIRDALATIERDHPSDPPPLLTAEAMSTRLALTLQPDVVSRLMGIADGTAVFQATAPSSLGVTIQPPLSAKYSYDEESGLLTCIGIMTADEQITLKGVSANADFKVAVEELYDTPERFICDDLGGAFADGAIACQVLLDRPAQTGPATHEEKLAFLYSVFVPIVRDELRHDAIVQHIAALIGLDEATMAVLIAADMADGLPGEVRAEGFSATYFSDVNFTSPVLATTDRTVDFAWGAGAPASGVPSANFSARWEAYVAPPATGQYAVRVDAADPQDEFSLYLDNALVLKKETTSTSLFGAATLSLDAAQMHLLKLEYAHQTGSSGVRLRWVLPAGSLEVVPSTVAHPASPVDAFLARAALWHRAAQFISGFALTKTELVHFGTYADDFGGIDFGGLKAQDWKRIADYVALRDAVPQAHAKLTDVFAGARALAAGSGSASLADVAALLCAATAWDRAAVDALMTSFEFTASDLTNEVGPNLLREAMRIVNKTGLSSETVAQWGAAETGFDELASTGELLKRVVKAKYDEEQWLDAARTLSDALRRRQQQALIAYLLAQPSIRAAGVTDADGLFEYFLIDVQMGSCMDTSRIAQATASAQMFVNRCLIGLESRRISGVEDGVSPSAIDKAQWEWMKNYRVWEANRKVFLYPENWLEPEWRNDRSEFFRDLESYLMQNDITDRSVEQGFRDYLTSLGEVANLEVCGLHRENYTGGKSKGQLKCLHVFARTHSTPYKYYYRRWDEYQTWSAWERLSVDIRGIDEGSKSGVHLLPVVWKNRLFLFWPEYAKKQREQETTGTIEELAQKTPDSLKPTTYFEVRLAWTECVDGKWSPKHIANGAYTLYCGSSDDIRFVRWIASVDAGGVLQLTAVVRIGSRTGDVLKGTDAFRLSDIVADTTVGDSVTMVVFASDRYYFDYMSHAKSQGKLELAGKVYLEEPTDHRLLVHPAKENLVPKLETPFFFSDLYRTYFVRPSTARITSVIGTLQDPTSYVPIASSDPEIFTPGGASEVSGLVGKGVPVERFGPPAPVVDGKPSRQRLLEPSVRRGGEAKGDMPLADPTTGTTVGSLELEPVSSDLAFDGFPTFSPASVPLRWETGLEFHTFHHPYAGAYVERLNRDGVRHLMASDTELGSDEGATFVDKYDPRFGSGLVHRPSDFDWRTYYKNNVCFDPRGANSLYNWELFFHAPLYIATRLSRNGRYEEAMKWFHCIFDPTTDEAPSASAPGVSRFWKVLPFRSTPSTTVEDLLRDLNEETAPSSPGYNPNSAFFRIVAKWRDFPFDPHRVAADRPLAYMKHVVIKYVENLIAWGDSLFRQFTRESVNQALQIYVIANHILGPRPHFVPKRGEIQAQTYDSLKGKWDAFSNALVELENVFPYSSAVAGAATTAGHSMLGVGSALYFCIPANEKLMDTWDTVADRLYKIRHCQDIQGVERSLALFSPLIDPGLLVKALSQGLSLGSILSDLGSAPPIYRFQTLLQKTNEFCAEVKALGAGLLAALEKKDAEELGRLRASHETQMLEAVTAVRERQVLDAKANRESLMKSRATAEFRLQHYIDLLGNASAKIPAPPTISGALTAETQLPADTNIETIKVDVDVSLHDADESGVKLIPREKKEIDSINRARDWQIAAQASEGLASMASVIPTFKVAGMPFGVGAGADWGGMNLASALSATGRTFEFIASFDLHEASLAAKMAGYIRREQDWTLLANLAAREIVQLDKQITSADIRIQVAQRELENHRKQIENSKEVELFLTGKFTSQELYHWMREQIFAVYKQSYNLAYDMAKKAEKAYKSELGVETAGFIQYGYWDNSMQGLVAGEKLQLALRQMEKSYLEENRRELELTKSISLARLDPLALIELRETGKCRVSLPEELFDLDFRGHYFRRIKSVRLSIPCVVGPYTSVNCTLRLLNNSIRINSALSSTYEHANEDGIWTDDDRFRTSYTPVTAIATSSGQNDAGMFDVNFRDERYLPFELAGAISEWQLELSTEKELRPFDYSTISDVILHLSYTAREAGGPFRSAASVHIIDFLKLQPLSQMFSMRHEFPNEWHQLQETGSTQLTLETRHLPYLLQGCTLMIKSTAWCARTATTSLPAISVAFGTDTSVPLILESTLDPDPNPPHLWTALSGSPSVTLGWPFTLTAANPADLEDFIVVVQYGLSA